jgi:hypothetical protein
MLPFPTCRHAPNNAYESETSCRHAGGPVVHPVPGLRARRLTRHLALARRIAGWV